MSPMWIYVAVAALIATVAFGIGQVAPGMGVVFVAGASGLWTAYSAHRANRLRAVAKARRRVR